MGMKGSLEGEFVRHSNNNKEVSKGSPTRQCTPPQQGRGQRLPRNRATHTRLRGIEGS